MELPNITAGEYLQEMWAMVPHLPKDKRADIVDHLIALEDQLETLENCLKLTHVTD